jgi:hypothetical protein
MGLMIDWPWLCVLYTQDWEQDYCLWTSMRGGDNWEFGNLF